MSAKRWTTGADYTTVAKCQVSPTFQGISFDADFIRARARQRRRDKSHRLGSPDHVDMVMATWTRDIPCAVCNEPWKAGVWATVGVDLLLYPTCGSNACNKQIRDDAIAENPGIN